MHKETAQQCLYRAAKYRAKKKGLPFDIKKEDIPEIPEFCPILGIQIKRSPKRGCSDTSPSLDRIIPELGYVVGNIRVVSHRANNLKSNASFDELFLVANDMFNIKRRAA